MLKRSRRVVIGWIALAAIWAVTLMPTFSRLLAPGADGEPGCPLHLAAASHKTGDDSRDGSTQAGFGDVCPFCVLAAELAPPPLKFDPGEGARVAFRQEPSAFLRAPRTSGVWLAARSRAPPPSA
jgi:hypothetical protein